MHPTEPQGSLWVPQLQGRLNACGDPWSKELWLVWTFIAWVFPISSKLETTLMGIFWYLLSPSFSSLLSLLKTHEAKSIIFPYDTFILFILLPEICKAPYCWSCVCPQQRPLDRLQPLFPILLHTQSLWSTHCRKISILLKEQEYINASFFVLPFV